MRRLLGAAWHPDIPATLRATITDARSRRGLIGGCLVAMAELVDLAKVAAATQLGHKTPISGGWRPSSPRGGQSMIRTLLYDTRLAIRTLMSSRATTVIAVATLALGIGVSSAMFSILDSVMLRPLPYHQPDQLVEIWALDTRNNFTFPRLSRAQLLQWRNQTDLFQRVEGYEIESAIYAGPQGAEMIGATYVTPDLFATLGVAPILGRALTTGDGQDGTDDRVVISERFWNEALQRDPAVIGRRLMLNERAHEVVGVMPSTFYFPNRPQQLWLPLDVDAPPARHLAQGFDMTAFARVRDDVSRSQVAEQVQARGERLNTAAGARPGFAAKVHLKGEFIDTKTRESLYVLSGAVGFLLLIVCANIANLSLSRVLVRTRDLAVRASLGATRLDLIRQTLMESLVVGVAGAGLGLLVAWCTLAAGTSWLPTQITFSTVNEIDLDYRVLWFAAGLGVVTPLLFGLMPAIFASRPNVLAALRQDTRTTAGSPLARRLRGVMVICEVTVAIVLLAGAALMGRSLYQLQSGDRGFDTDNLIALRLGLPSNGYVNPYVRDQFTEDLMTRVRQLPGVQQVSAGAVPPDSSMISWGQVEFQHDPKATTAKELIFPIYTVWPGYFDAIGLRLKEGRDFQDGDTSNEVIISETFARDFWPNRSAVGQQFRFVGGKTWKTVVGVATDVRQLDLDDTTGSYEWFQPLRTPPGRPIPAPRQGTTSILDYRTVLVRANNPAAVIPELTKAVHAQDPRVVIWETNLVNDLFSEAIERPRIVLVALAVFATLGLVLAAAGLYGVLSHLVSQRLREFGIRLALGAHPEAVFRLIIRSGLALTIAGIVVGLAAAGMLARLMGSLLYQVNPLDPVVFGLTALVLLVTAVAACWRPARRAMRTNPVALLRES